MKKLAALILTTIHCSLFTNPCSAAVPLRWTVETSRVQPAVFEAFHGEALDLEASFTSYGKPLETPVQGDWKIYWQTNGMADAWWSAPATVQQPTTDNQQPATTATAVFTPAMDPGASVVTGFIGLPGENYRAAFIIRFRHGPGASPNALPLPAKTLDFSKITVLNAPWSDGGGGGGAVLSVNSQTGAVVLTAADVGAAPIDESGLVDAAAFRGNVSLVDGIYNMDAGAPWIDVANGILNPDVPGSKWYYHGNDNDNEIAVKGDIADAISPESPAFSNAVLAVGLNIDTNGVAVLNEIAATFGGFPVEGTATTLGGLLAALAAAIAYLKKNKAGLDDLIVRMTLVGDGTVANPYAVQLDGTTLAFAEIKSYANGRNAVIQHGQGTYRVTYVGSNEMMWDCTGTVQGVPKTGMIHIFAAGNVVQLVPAKDLVATADSNINTAEKIVAHILAQFDNGETEAF